MASVSSNFKATVSFGGTVSRSFFSSSAALQKEIQRTEKETDKLRKKQQALLASIRAGKEQGKDVAALRQEYRALGGAITAAERRSKSLNRSLRQRKGLGFAGKHLGLTAMRENLRERGRTIRDKGLLPTIAPGMLRATGMAGGLLAGGVGGAIAINAQTAEQSRIAKSYGVSLKTFQTWGGMAKQAGLSAENIGDLSEELANKVGEFTSLGKQSSLEDGLMMLGLSPNELKGKSNQEQFAMILNRAAKATDPQVARSAIDMIMGGEGNKIVATLKALGKTYEELDAEQKRYILTTEEGDRGAVEGQRALDNLWATVSTAAQEILGVVFGSLAPGIQSWVESFGNWFRTGGRDILITRLEAFGNGIRDFWGSKLKPVLSSLWVGLKWLADFIDRHLTTYDDKTAKAETREEVKALSEEEGLRQAAELGLSPMQATRYAGTFSDREVNKWDATRTRDISEYTPPVSQEERLKAVLAAPDIKSPSSSAGTQNNNLSVTVLTQPGDDAQAIGSAVGSSIFNVLSGGDADNGTFSPASLGG